MIKLIIFLAGSLLLLTFIIFRTFFYVIQVDGSSMLPTYKQGDLLLALKIFNPIKAKYRVGDVYVYVPPHTQEKDYLVIKRVADVKCAIDNKVIYFKGDNAKESYDSRAYGYVSCKNVRAKIILGGTTHAR